MNIEAKFFKLLVKWIIFRSLFKLYKFSNYL
jgi:hypothetical protein